MRWLLRPEADSTFSCDEELREALRASCHIPVLGGLWPYAPHRSDGSHRGSYFDGLFWPSVLYMWRAFDSSDALLKVSGIGWPTSHIHLPVPTPPHWILLPPSTTSGASRRATRPAHFFSQRAARDRLFPRRRRRMAARRPPPPAVALGAASGATTARPHAAATDRHRMDAPHPPHPPLPLCAAVPRCARRLRPLSSAVERGRRAAIIL